MGSTARDLDVGAAAETSDLRTSENSQSSEDQPRRCHIDRLSSADDAEESTTSDVEYDILSTDYVPQRRLRPDSQVETSLNLFAARRRLRRTLLDQSVASHAAVAGPQEEISRATIPCLGKSEPIEARCSKYASEAIS